MPILDKNRIFDGFDSLEGGVDAGRRANVIGVNQAVSAENAVFRGGLCTTRPGIRKLDQKFLSELYYDQNGIRVASNSVIHDAVINGTSLSSKTAFFTASDLGSVLVANLPIIFGTKIAQILSPSEIVMSIPADYPTFGYTVTIVSRTSPTTFLGGYDGNVVSANSANFQPKDVGAAITGSILPTSGIIILEVIDPQTAIINATMAPEVGVAFTMPNRPPLPVVFTGEAFSSNLFQGASYYSPRGGTEVLIAMVGGRPYRITPHDHEVDIDEIVLGEVGKSSQNRGTLNKAYLVQADKWMVIQDGESIPILYDNATARRAKEDEVPVGEIMAYGMGRLVVIRKGHEIFFGDLYASHAGDDPGDSVIKFTETTFLSEGFPASIQFAMGRITAASFFPQLDTSTGTGQLFIFTDRGACGFDMTKPREEWKTSSFQTVTLASTGVRGWRSISPLNEDLWFRSSDGARTFRQARSEARGWTHIPLSTNVRQWLDADTPELLDYCSSIVFDNRFLVTCTPIWNHGRLYHSGILALDFDVLSSFGSNARPAWDGHWSKLKVTQLVEGIFKGRRRAFAFGLDENMQNQIYEITLSARDDFDGPINGEMVCRSFDFSRDNASNPFSEKELYGGDVWVNAVGDETATLRAAYRPDGYPDWLAWDNEKPLTIIGDYGPVTPGVVPTMNFGFFPRLTLKKPNDGADTDSTKRTLRRAFDFNVKFNWTGHLCIQRFRIHAQQLTEKSRA